MKRVHIGPLLGAVGLFALVWVASCDVERIATQSMPVTKIVTVRAASGDLTAGENTTPISTGGYVHGAMILDVTTCTTPDGDDEVDFYVQADYGDGNWTDLENVHLANADNGTTPTYVLVFGYTDVQATDNATAVTDGTLTDDTKLRLPLGARLRFKTTVTGATAPTYAYNSTMFLTN